MSLEVHEASVSRCVAIKVKENASLTDIKRGMQLIFLSFFSFLFFFEIGELSIFTGKKSKFQSGMEVAGR